MLALALPLQGAWAMAGSAAHAPSQRTDAPCAHCPEAARHDARAAHGPAPHDARGIDKSACGACCAPLLAIAPSIAAAAGPAMAGAMAVPPTPDAAPARFLTGGPDRPPRPEFG